MTKNEDTSNTQWHKLLGKLLKDLLSPVDLDVFTEFPLMTESPKVDVLLVRRKTPQWTEEQLALLPDGIRDTTATDIIIEFKYTESLNDEAIEQTLGYNHWYKQRKNVIQENVKCFLLSSKQPQKSTLKKLGYRNTELKGVYRSQFRLIRKVTLLSLNELANEPHNAYVKCFASHRQEKEKAFEMLEKNNFKSLANPLRYFISGLKGFWFTLEGDKMKLEVTEEQIAEMGKRWGETYLSSLPTEEVLSHYDPQEVLSHYDPQEVLSHYDPQEVLSHYDPQEVLSHYDSQQVLAGLSPQQIEELKKLLQK